MEPNAASSTETDKRLWHIVRAVFVMLGEGLSKRRIFSDLRLHLLFHQGKLAGRSLRSLVSNLAKHYHSSIHPNAVETFSCRFMEPDAVIIPPRKVEFNRSNLPFHATARRKEHHLSCRPRSHRFHLYDAIPPREVEFSCSNTPFHATARRKAHQLSCRPRSHHFHRYDAAAVARAFEILDSVPDNGEAMDEMPTPMMSVLATPAASVRPLRVTDSPFPVKENEDIDEALNWEAEEFIRQFYQQLQLQQMGSY